MSVPFEVCVQPVETIRPEASIDTTFILDSAITEANLSHFIAAEAQIKGTNVNAPIFEKLRDLVLPGKFNIDPNHVWYRTVPVNGGHIHHPFDKQLLQKAYEIVGLGYNLHYGTGDYCPLDLKTDDPDAHDYCTVSYTLENGSLKVIATLSTSYADDAAKLSMNHLFKAKGNVIEPRAGHVQGKTAELRRMAFAPEFDIVSLSDPRNAKPRIMKTLAVRGLWDAAYRYSQKRFPCQEIEFGCIMAPRVVSFVRAAGIPMQSIPGFERDNNNDEVIQISSYFPNYWSASDPPGMQRIGYPIADIPLKLNGERYILSGKKTEKLD